MKVITRENRLPLYIQLKDLIIEQIEKKKWQPGDAIPTEKELQKAHQVSRTTVRQALYELVNEGVLNKIQGKGTFVAQPKLEPIRPDVTGFTQDMAIKGRDIRSIVLETETVQAEEKIARALHQSVGIDLFKLVRLRLLDGVVIGYHEAYINKRLVGAIPLDTYDFANGSLYECLKQEGLVLGVADETVEAGLAGELYANFLGISANSPVLKLTRVTHLQDGSPLEYVKMVYRADRYKYTLRLH